MRDIFFFDADTGIRYRKYDVLTVAFFVTALYRERNGPFIGIFYGVIDDIDQYLPTYDKHGIPIYFTKISPSQGESQGVIS